MWLWVQALIFISVLSQCEGGSCNNDSDCVNQITCNHPANMKCSHHKHCYCDQEHCHKASDCHSHSCRNGQVMKCGHGACFCDQARCSSDHDCYGVVCNEGQWKKCNTTHHSCYCLQGSTDVPSAINHTTSGSVAYNHGLVKNNNQFHRCNMVSDCTHAITCQYPENVQCTNHICYCANEHCKNHAECYHLGCGNTQTQCEPHGACACIKNCSTDNDCHYITCSVGESKACFNNRACYCKPDHTSSTNAVQQHIKVDGHWGNWGHWGACSATCGHGSLQWRYRSCNNPAPQYGGSNCAGLIDKQHKKCHYHACPVQQVTTSTSHPITVNNQQQTTIDNHGCATDHDCSWINCNGKSKCSDQHFCYCDIKCNNTVDCRFIHCDSTHYKQCTYGGHCVCAQGPEHCTRHSQCSSITCQKGHNKKCSNQHHCYCSREFITQSQPPCQDHVCPNGEVPWATKEGVCTCVQSHASTSNTHSTKVDGHWSSWGRFGTCSVSCDMGVKMRYRQCNNPSPLNGGLQCNGPSQESHRCTYANCPIDGHWSAWLPWPKCPVTCGGGLITRLRYCNHPAPNYGGKYCVGNATMTMKCHTNNCPVDGGWSTWTDYGKCSVTCGAGKQFRHRTCSNPHPLYGGKACNGTNNEAKTCSSSPCPVDGKWSVWSKWNHCSVTCGTGSISRYRVCNNPVPTNGGANCTGSDHETHVCNKHQCPLWTDWQGWSQCTVSCGVGTQSRSRSCIDHNHHHHKHDCMGAPLESMSCNVQACPVNGGWSNWTNWTQCSVSCGSGLMTRSRSCDNPKPDHGGATCIGYHSESGVCNAGDCPVDGQWSGWSTWSHCSVTCENGIRNRDRKCDNPSPSGGGQNCTGSRSESQVCSQSACPIDGGWSFWNTWTSCSESCGFGVRTRYRQCDNPPPFHGGIPCSGIYNQTESCNKPPCPVDGGWSAWLFTACSATCGDGTRSRVRLCNNPIPSNGGLFCNGSANQTEACNERACVVSSSAAPTKWITVPFVANQFECHQCGGNGTPCSNQELNDPSVRPSACPADKGYCMSDVTTRDGNVSVKKRCVDKSTCDREWIQQSSDKDYCVIRNQVKMSGTYECHFCCTKSGCNSGIVPSNSTLYTGR